MRIALADELGQRELALPASASGAQRSLEVLAPPGATFGAMHYWIVED